MDRISEQPQNRERVGLIRALSEQCTERRGLRRDTLPKPLGLFANRLYRGAVDLEDFMHHSGSRVHGAHEEQRSHIQEESASSAVSLF